MAAVLAVAWEVAAVLVEEVEALQEIRSIATNKIVETSAKSSQLVPVASKRRSLGVVATKRVVLGCLRGMIFVGTKLAFCNHLFGQLPLVFPLRHSPSATYVFRGYNSSATNTEPCRVTTVATARVPLHLLFRCNSPVYLPRPILWQETMSTNLIRVEKTICHKQFNRGNKNFQHKLFWWRQTKATMKKFRGDTLFQHKLFLWRQIVATCKIFVAMLYFN